MDFINALELIDLCIEHKILAEQEGNVFVYRDKGKRYEEGWYLEEKCVIDRELMHDKYGQNVLISELNKKNIKFIENDYMLKLEGILSLFK